MKRKKRTPEERAAELARFEAVQRQLREAIARIEAELAARRTQPTDPA